MLQFATKDAAMRRVADGVYLADLAAGDRASMKFWRVEPGATIPSHSHPQEQIGYVVRGELIALVEGAEHRLEPGDSYLFASGERHGAENRSTEPAEGLGFLSPPRERPQWRETNE